MTRVERVRRERGGPARGRLPETILHLDEPVAVVDRGEDALVRATEALVLQHEVLGHRQHELLGARAEQRDVEGADILLDRDGGERARVDLVRHAAQDGGHVGRGDRRGPEPRSA